jgi:ABC-type glycerol-3-phosphate transport system substrate-binding protein
MAGCAGDEAPGVPEETDTPPAPVESVLAMVEPTPAPESTPEGPSVTTLTWWTPPHFSPDGEDQASQLVASQLEQFVQGNSNLELNVIQKAPYGKGGVLDFLLTTQKAAPALLPDLVSLDGDELAVAMRADLLQPLDDLLSPELLNDLYPFATAVGRHEGKTYAIQFESELVHLAVNTERVEQAPRGWTDVLTGKDTYLFSPGPEGNPSDAFLIQYMAAGGQIGGRDEPFVLDAVALLRVLDFYEKGRAAGVIPSVVTNLASTEAAWPLFLEGRGDMASVLASRYLSERNDQPNLAFDVLPTASEQPTNISDGWTLALVATDPERQAVAAQLIESLLSADFNGTWTQAAHRLPVRRAALDVWPQDDPYVSFVRWQLEAARVHPSGSSYLEAAPILSQAARDVLSGTASAREATERATGMSAP